MVAKKAKKTEAAVQGAAQKHSTAESTGTDTPSHAHARQKKPEEQSASHPEKHGQESKKQEHHAKEKEKSLVQAEVNIGMVGHVDHGKTSLVQALTGKWTDTHSEEIKKGISIRLGYADATFYKCEGAEGSGSESYNSTGKCESGKAVPLRRVSFVDAPGHETLMATMLSGAALMNGAVLVVAANEKCPQPRTAEHLMALSISGVKNIVVAQNKIDLVDRKRALESVAEIRAFLKEHGYENKPIVPISANLMLNIDMLIKEIEENIPSPKHEAGGDFRMHVVRSFDVNKPGTKPEDIVGGILGGSIITGKLKVGDTIEISPGIDGKPMQTTVLTLGVEGSRVEEARAGGLVAVGTKLDPFYTKNDEMRGQIAAKPGTLPLPVMSVRMEVKPLERLIVDGKSGELRVNDFVVLAIGVATIIGQVSRVAGKNEFEFALRSPAVVEKGMQVAISKKEPSGWRLRAYGICK
ncbi:Translation initiation factor 2 subunit gamma [uncultured archaeon]|nr:Translation initiation factor 2 subunit gamma [uncultured archaeon]